MCEWECAYVSVRESVCVVCGVKENERERDWALQE